MMAINRKLIHFKTKQNFEAEIANRNILDTSIVFIQDSGEIWTHGLYYATLLTEGQIEQIVINSETVQEAIEQIIANTVPIITDGDGLKFLANDGEYKSIDTFFENNIDNYFFIVGTEQISGGYLLKDITFDEIIEKFNNGGNMVCHVDETDYIPLLSVTTNKIIFSGIYNTTSVSLVFDTDGKGTLTSTYLGTPYQISSAKTEAINESKTYTDAAIANLDVWDWAEL